ncbi:replication initiation protein [Bordetella sp. 02P26C-1]|uniref:replication initiation protein n=1 Tax=Bordetella sp. 02P26C-1 TaxID=2683195 RepID=UPI001355DE6E|nr:replication initiation protein [Bordetella sp. 02P26C-1]MVW77677.1 RepB family plasmid replication initiator protein [Bordetella sp. 02P26C-1]
MTALPTSPPSPDNAPPKNDGKAMQLALSLFSELGAHGAGADHLPVQVGFHKNNLFINIVDMSLSARRAIDVLYFITAQDPEYKSGYRIDLNIFKWLMGYTSNNRKHLQSILREAQKAAVQIESSGPEASTDEPWASIPMLGPVAIANGKIFFEIHHRLQAEIKSPAASHFLSLRYVFKSIHAKILFDRLQLFIAQGTTGWISLDELRGWWGFKADEYAEFKKMRQRVIEKAVSQINEVTGLHVSYDTKNVPGSKRVGNIRFQIEKTAQFDAPQASMIALKAQYEVLRNEFGLNGAQLDEIISHRDEWDDDRLQKAIEYTRYQIAQGKVKRSVAGYFMKAVREAYALGTAQLQIDAIAASNDIAVSPNPLQQAVAAREQAIQAEVDQLETLGHTGYEAYLAMEPAQRAEVLREFIRSLPARTLAVQLHIEPAMLATLVGDNTDVQTQLGAFVAMRTVRTTRRRRVAIP